MKYFRMFTECGPAAYGLDARSSISRSSPMSKSLLSSSDYDSLLGALLALGTGVVLLPVPPAPAEPS